MPLENKKKIPSVFLAVVFLATFFFFSFSQNAQAKCDGDINAEINASGKCVCKPGYIGNPLDTDDPHMGCVFQRDVEGEKGFVEGFASTIVLQPIFILTGWLVQMAAVALGWVLDPALYGSKSIMDQPAIYILWQQLTGLFNMFFILILLFSAFATIFQVDKYSIKKLWLSILIAALLINFSFPIARFIIDVSNVTMFSLLNDTSGLNIATNILSQSALTTVLFPTGFDKAPAAHQMMAIIFMFIIGMTLFILAALMIIRLLMLIILIMLSPVGFVGSAFPGMSKWSSKWWDALFNYSFFGPIMVFGIMVSTRLFAELGPAMKTQFTSHASSVSGVPKFIGDAVYFLIPVMTLWIFMGIAKSFSIVGAGAVIDRGQKFSKWVGNLPLRAGKGVWRGTGIPGGFKSASDEFKKSGKILGRKVPLYGGSDETARRAALIGGALKDPKDGWKNARIEHERKLTNELRKEWKGQEGAGFAQLEDMLKNGSAHEKRAAALEMAEKNGFGDTDDQRKANYKLAVSAIGNDDKVVKKMFDDKVDEKHIKWKIEAAIDKAGTGADRQKIYNDNLSKMSFEKIAGQKGIHEDTPELYNYINATVSAAVARGGESGKNAVRELADAAKKLSGKDKEYWRTGGVRRTGGVNMI